MPWISPPLISVHSPEPVKLYNVVNVPPGVTLKIVQAQPTFSDPVKAPIRSLHQRSDWIAAVSRRASEIVQGRYEPFGVILKTVPWLLAPFSVFVP